MGGAIRAAVVVRIVCRAYPDDDEGAAIMPGGWRLVHRGHWTGPWRLTRAEAEADARAPDLVPSGRATPLTS